jgi:hypothetical protein
VKWLGVILANAKLTAWPDSVPKMGHALGNEKKMFARQTQATDGSVE